MIVDGLVCDDPESESGDLLEAIGAGLPIYKTDVITDSCKAGVFLDQLHPRFMLSPSINSASKHWKSLFPSIRPFQDLFAGLIYFNNKDSFEFRSLEAVLKQLGAAQVYLHQWDPKDTDGTRLCSYLDEYKVKHVFTRVDLDPQQSALLPPECGRHKIRDLFDHVINAADNRFPCPELRRPRASARPPDPRADQ